MKFDPGIELYAGFSGSGAIIADGKADTIIIFTSNKTSPSPGDWMNVGLYSLAMNTSSFSYCTFMYGGSSSAYPGEFYATGIPYAKINNCTFQHSGNFGVYIDDNAGLTSFANNTITSCAQYPLQINAEYVRTIGTGNTFTGNTINAIHVTGGTVITSGTWVNPGVPYVIESDVNIQSNATSPVITIAPGNTLKFQPGVEFYTGWAEVGGLIADGTAGKITFTSNVASPSPGDWFNIGFYGLSIDASCKLINCKLEYAGGNGSYPGNLYIYESLPTITGDSIGNSLSYGIYYSGTVHPDSTTMENSNYFFNCPSGNVGHP